MLQAAPDYADPLLLAREQAGLLDLIEAHGRPLDRLQLTTLRTYAAWQMPNGFWEAFMLPDERDNDAAMPRVVDTKAYRAAIRRIETRLFHVDQAHGIRSVTVCRALAVFQRRSAIGIEYDVARIGAGTPALMPEERAIGRLVLPLTTTLDDGESRTIALGRNAHARLSAHDRIALKEVTRILGGDNQEALMSFLDPEAVLRLGRTGEHAYLDSTAHHGRHTLHAVFPLSGEI